ncbi:hypothetical protein EYF80_016654 [Liparis tanakae]|uniref:Uncharacterized protein n=1 Tax=Liparis tanakae TaxID=230148 RepID=A0A4Z2I5C5_9TELE|nr:hypothetical protein EYF80_016654 [Liparis tanakae]
MYGASKTSLLSALVAAGGSAQTTAGREAGEFRRRGRKLRRPRKEMRDRRTFAGGNAAVPAFSQAVPGRPSNETMPNGKTFREFEMDNTAVAVSPNATPV